MGYTVEKTDVFDEWLRRLKDRDGHQRINARLKRAEHTGNLGDVKYVAEGVNEMRIDCGPGYRLYFVNEDGALIVLLCGGDKDSQGRDIERAIGMAKERKDAPKDH